MTGHSTNNIHPWPTFAPWTLFFVKSRNPKLHSAPRTWRSFRWLWDPPTAALCIGPFVWALPVFGAAIETLVRTSRDRYPAIYYSNTYCNIDDYQYQQISGVIVGMPLVVSLGLVLATFAMIIRIYIRDRATASQSINLPLAFRFAAIVLQIFIMTIILLCEIALKDNRLRGVFRFHLYWAALGPFVLFIIFGTQRDLMRIWKYWAYRLVGKEPAFTPRSSNEAATLSNSSGLGTMANGRYNTTAQGPRELQAVGRKSHRVSFSAGARDSVSISDRPELSAVKHTTDLHRDEVTSNPDLELALVTTDVHSPGSQTPQASPLSPLTFPALPYVAELSVSPAPSANARQTDFYSTPADMSSQGLNTSTISHSGGQGLLASYHPSRSNQPLIVVTRGFDAMFGAQVGQPIISPQERERRLAVPTAARRPSFNGGIQIERRRSTGLPPPPRQSIGRPTSAGRSAAGEREGPAPTGTGASVAAPSPVAAAWNWDSPFRSVGKSAPLAPITTHTSDSGSGSRGDTSGIELQEHLKTPSNRSSEHGRAQRSSQEQHSDSARGSWARASRASVASDRTFG
ncbi:hypothetical protein FRC07_014921 [Ceratobasidium sp. 392]|nr:hypothetical protein FRC07_014921 [Ceratobasidium sp. 392]